MAGVKSLRKMQLGKETTPGTAVAATAVWRGEGVGKDASETRHPPEDIGVLSTHLTRNYTPRYLTEIEMAEADCTFEQLPYIFEAGVESETPSQDGAGSDYIYTYNFATTAQNTVKTYTIEYGDDQQEYESPYCFVKEFTIKGGDDGVLQVTANWVGRQVSKSSYTSLTAQTVETIIFQNAKWYINTSTTFPATAQKTNHLISFELQVTTGLMEKFTASGFKYFSHHVQVRPEVKLSVTGEHDATSVALFDDFQANTVKSFRLEFTGAALTTPGTTYSTKKFLIDLIGVIDSGPEMDEADGNNLFNFEMTCGYTVAAASAGRFIVVNELSALT